MRPLKILFTNNTLAARGGTDLWVRDRASARRRRGHVTAAYSPLPGDVANDLRDAGIDVVDDIERLPWTPDILHAHHHFETMTVLARYPSLRAMFICHGVMPWEEEPPLHPNIRRWVAVDLPTRERLLSAGAEPDRIALLHNFVDLQRFTARDAIPPRPRRALVFSNQIDRSNGFHALERACRKEGVEMTVAGIASGNVLDRPENVLGQFDVVFAKGRAALEAMASGCAVILCDKRGVGPYVTSAELATLRDLNFGMKTLTEPLSVDVLRDRLRAYDREDAMRVTAWVRDHASLDRAATGLESIYEACLGEPWQPDAGEQACAMARYLASVALRVKYHEGIRRERDILAARAKRLAWRELIFGGDRDGR